MYDGEPELVEILFSPKLCLILYLIRHVCTCLLFLDLGKAAKYSKVTASEVLACNLDTLGATRTRKEKILYRPVLAIMSSFSSDFASKETANEVAMSRYNGSAFGRTILSNDQKIISIFLNILVIFFRVAHFQINY